MGNRKKFLIAFPASNLSECGFSFVIQPVTKQRSRLIVADKRELKFSLTEIQPEIYHLVARHTLSK